jgi:hypothetical protein
MTPVPELNDLVDTVGDRCPTGTELDKLRAASDVAREVGRVGEDLVTHFVDEARAAGASWADIGDVLGVSRQGAHQRHHDRPRPDRWWRADLGRFTPRARAALKAAAQEARTAGNSFIGSEHILLGVLTVPDNLGTKALVRCGVNVEALAAATKERLVPAGQDPTEPLGRPFGRGRGGRGGRGGRPPWAGPRDLDEPRTENEGDADERPGGRGFRLPFTASGRRVFDLTLGSALELGHNYIGCEHLVIGLARGEGTAAEVIRATGTTPEKLVESVEAICAELTPKP